MTIPIPAHRARASEAQKQGLIDITRNNPKPPQAKGLERLSDRIKDIGYISGKVTLGLALAPPALTLIAGAYVGSKALMLPVLGMAKLADAFRDLGSKQAQVKNLHSQLGAPMENGILSKNVDTPSGQKSIADIMEKYRTDLNSKVSANEMKTYINMGERIVSRLNQLKDYNGGPLVMSEVGVDETVSPNLDSARAISWFLQAKAVKDNADNSHEAILLNRGSMLMEDPDGKLFKFLKSAPNTYGRASTHFNERSEEKAYFRNTGLAGGVINLPNRIKNALSNSGKPLQAAQLGIEDFSSKFPSGKGCLLFNKLEDQDNNNQQQLFMKWETAGMPNFINPTGTHADPESGFTGKIYNRFGAFDRCIQHTFNFLKLGRSGGRWGIHRENVHKGEPKDLYKRFGDVMKSIETSQGKHKNWSMNLIAEAKIKGIDFILDVLEGLRDIDINKGLPIDRLIKEIIGFKDRQGKDLGIRRKGAEVHVQLDDADPQQKQLQRVMQDHESFVTEVNEHLSQGIQQNEADNFIKIIGERIKHWVDFYENSENPETFETIITQTNELNELKGALKASELQKQSTVEPVKEKRQGAAEEFLKTAISEIDERQSKWSNFGLDI
ncbi:hypothetical protein [Marinibactrum halimedae]|uniref:Uncharacterized protein n=1 Tax=Marinibactrum halimedae TaxID=1444977 RepID=A0AA37WQ16_9GAMM|nr:hypothetical protein [Marinibactrum halimedae]MCD9459029.1 hypothetical protein [Marinibactrum halimedae]GLS26842.1 hypothetical protein GCM10007877_25610 [Marinibactrum halimedae]